MKPYIACGVIILIALGFSWAISDVALNCEKSGEIVNCEVEERLFIRIPFNTTYVKNLQEANLKIDAGSFRSTGNSTTDSYHLVLIDASGSEHSYFLPYSPADSKNIVEGVNNFLESNESQYTSWTFSALQLAPVFIALVGLIFLSMVVSGSIGRKKKKSKSV